MDINNISEKSVATASINNEYLNSSCLLCTVFVKYTQKYINHTTRHYYSVHISMHYVHSKRDQL